MFWNRQTGNPNSTIGLEQEYKTEMQQTDPRFGMQAYRSIVMAPPPQGPNLRTQSIWDDEELDLLQNDYRLNMWRPVVGGRSGAVTAGMAAPPPAPPLKEVSLFSPGVPAGVCSCWRLAGILCLCATSSLCFVWLAGAAARGVLFLLRRFFSCIRAAESYSSFHAFKTCNVSQQQCRV